METRFNSFCQRHYIYVICEEKYQREYFGLIKFKKNVHVNNRKYYRYKFVQTPESAANC